MDLQQTKARVEEVLRARDETETLPLMQRFNTVANLLKRNKKSLVPAQMLQYIMNGGQNDGETKSLNVGKDKVDVVRDNDTQKTRPSQQVGNTTVSSPGSDSALGEARKAIHIETTTAAEEYPIPIDIKTDDLQQPMGKMPKSGENPAKKPDAKANTTAIKKEPDNKISNVINTASVIPPPSFVKPEIKNISNDYTRKLFRLNQLKKNYIQNKIDYYYLKPVVEINSLDKKYFKSEKIDCLTEKNQPVTLKIKNLRHIKNNPQYSISKQELLSYVQSENQFPKKQVGEAFLIQVFGKKPLQNLTPSQETSRYKIVSIDHHDFIRLKDNYL